MSREPLEAMALIDSMAQNQQWSGRDNTRPRGGGRFEVDQMTAMTAKMDAMQKAMDRLSVKAVEQQSQACVVCGDENHAYEQCPMVQPEEETEQVHSLNNEPSFFPKPPFNRSYSKDPVEQQNWRWNQTMLKDHPSTTISATLLQTTAGTTRLRATTTATSTKTLLFPTKATERLKPVPQDHMCLLMRTTSRMSKAR